MSPVPTEVAAYSCGLYVGGESNWKTIAAMVAANGFGTFTPRELFAAAAAWSEGMPRGVPIGGRPEGL